MIKYTKELHEYLETLEKEASPAPWESSDHGEGNNTYLEHPVGDVLTHSERGYGHTREDIAWISKEDAELITATRNALPALLAEIKRLKQENN